jgi:hypothetical protein
MSKSEASYIPNRLLARLIGGRMYSIEFVLNDYVQLRFDGAPGADESVTLNCYVWPTIETSDRVWRESDLGYADVMRGLTPGGVISTVETTGVGIRIELDAGVIVIHPERDEVYVEIAHIMGFADHSWMVWRPGEDSFEDLA